MLLHVIIGVHCTPYVIAMVPLVPAIHAPKAYICLHLRDSSFNPLAFGVNRHAFGSSRS